MSGWMSVFVEPHIPFSPWQIRVTVHAISSRQHQPAMSESPCSCRSRRNSRSSPSCMRSSLPDTVNTRFTFADADTLRVSLEVGRMLGSGGFGSVFEGRCADSGRRVAVKKLHQCSKNQHAMVEAFEAERQIISLPRHRNIVRVLALSSADTTAASERLVLMEFAGERNLSQVINDEREKLTEFRRFKFATDIASALYCLHKARIAHLDVKPANILVTATDTCKLGDFGCCKRLTDEREDGKGEPSTPTTSYLTGTLAYRSPELLKGEPPSCASDMYSYAVCLWQLLTRSRPYGAENLYVVIFGVVSYQLRPTVTTDMRATNPAYVRLIEDLWTAEPGQRPTSMRVMNRLRTMRRSNIRNRSLPVSNVRWKI